MTPRHHPPPAFSEKDAEQLSLALNILWDLHAQYGIGVHADVWTTGQAEVSIRVFPAPGVFASGACKDRPFTGGAIRLTAQDLADMEQEAWEAACIRANQLDNEEPRK